MTSTTQGPKKTTFVVHVYYTANHTWQGRLGEVRTGKMRTFRSCLEMLKLMDEYLTPSTAAEEEQYDTV